jgi:RimJ/RimL family protein N-acetyltransferase
VGWGGLCVDPFDPGWGIEVLYFFDPACWGRGYATELVAASLRHAFRDLELPQVGAFATSDNLASIRVLEKSGFRFVDFVPALARNRYRATRAPAADAV